MKNILILCFILFTIGSNAQTENLKIGYQELPTTVSGQTSDSSGNIYYSGTFRGELKIKDKILKTGSGLEDIFLVKTKLSGEIIYTRSFGSSNSDLSVRNTLIHSKNNLYLGARLTDDAVLHSTAVTVYPDLKSAGAATNLLINMDTAGNVKWVTKTSLPFTRVYESSNIIHLIGVSSGGTPLYVNDQVLAGPTGYISLVHLMLDTSGKLLNFKRISPRASRRAENVDQVQFFAPFSDGKICMLLRVTAGVSIEFGNKTIPLPPTWGFQILIKTDTSYQNFTFKILNDRMEFTNKSSQDFPIALSKEDSLFMVLTTEYSQALQYDGLNINAQNKNVLVVLDSSLIAKRVTVLGSTYSGTSASNISQSRLYYKSVNTITNGLFFTGVFMGVNESPSREITKIETSVNIFPGVAPVVDQNGASKTFALQSSRSLDAPSFTWIGDHSNFEFQNPPLYYVNTVKDSLLIFSFQQDNVWNPFIINKRAQIVSGSMLPNADRADNVNYIEYLPDASRIIIGLARGKTALDDSSASIKSNPVRADAFIARISAAGKLMWYKRFSSTLVAANPKKLVVRNGLIYFLINYSNSVNQDNYLKAGDSTYNIGTTASLFGTVDTSGKVSIVSLENDVLKNAEIVHFSFWANNNVAVLTDNKKVLPFSTSFPLNTGFYLFKVNVATKKVVDGRKFTGATHFSPAEVQIDSSDVIYLSSPLVFGTSTDRYTTIGLHDSIKMIGSVQIENNIPFGPNQYGYGIIRMKWNEITWYKRSGGINGFGTGLYHPSLFLLKDKLVFMGHPGTVAGANGFTWDNAWSITSMTPGKHYLFKMDAASGVMEDYKIINGFGLVNAKNKENGNLFLSGRITQQTAADTIAIGFDGVYDALALILNTDFKFIKSYRFGSPYMETMGDFDIYRDSLKTFAYTAQTAAVLKNNRTSALASDYAEDAFIATDVIQRFSILPSKIISFNASNKEENVKVDWTIASNEAGSKFVVQRSTNGNAFNDVILISSVNSASLFSYNAADQLSSYGSYFYRLKVISPDGKISYSNTVLIVYAPKETNFYYDPASRQLKIFRTNDKSYQYSIFDANGRKVNGCEKISGNRTINLSNLSAGHYTLTVYEEPSEVLTYRFIR